MRYRIDNVALEAFIDMFSSLHSHAASFVHWPSNIRNFWPRIRTSLVRIPREAGYNKPLGKSKSNTELPFVLQIFGIMAGECWVLPTEVGWPLDSCIHKLNSIQILLANPEEQDLQLMQETSNLDCLSPLLRVPASRVHWPNPASQRFSSINLWEEGLLVWI